MRKLLTGENMDGATMSQMREEFDLYCEIKDSGDLTNLTQDELGRYNEITSVLEKVREKYNLDEVN